MPMNPDINPSAFFLEGDSTGVLLIHGFTGAPTEMRLMGNYFNARGLTISAPLLPGHGTTPDDLNEYRWIDWFDHVKLALSQLQANCDTITVAGLSMGGLLTLNLAATQPNIRAIVTYAAPVEVGDIRKYLPSFLARIKPQSSKPEEFWADQQAESQLWSYDTYPSMAAIDLLKQIPRIKKRLPRITCPYLAVYSTNDSLADPEGIRAAFDNVSSVDKELLEIHDSGHAITLDRSWKWVAEESYRFIKQYLPEN